MNLLQENLTEAENDVMITISSQKSAYDSEKGMAIVSVQRGVDDANITAFRIFFDFAGDSVETTIPAQGSNTVMLHSFDVSDSVEEYGVGPSAVAIAPVYSIGSGTKEGRRGTDVSIKNAGILDRVEVDYPGLERDYATNNFLLDLVVYWPMDGDLNDAVGSNDGACTGNDCPSYVDGKFGQAGKFDGSGTRDGVAPGDNVAVNESVTRTDGYPEGATYSVWVNVDTDAEDRMSLFRGHPTKNHIEIYSSGKYFRTEAAIENQYSFGTSFFSDVVRGEWSHFVIVFAESEPNRPVRWYQNGELFHTGSMSGGGSPGTEYFSFGSIGRSTGRVGYLYAKSFDGAIDEVMIFDKALSDSEVRALYEME